MPDNRVIFAANHERLFPDIQVHPHPAEQTGALPAIYHLGNAVFVIERGNVVAVHEYHFRRKHGPAIQQYDGHDGRLQNVL